MKNTCEKKTPSGILDGTTVFEHSQHAELLQLYFPAAPLKCADLLNNLIPFTGSSLSNSSNRDIQPPPPVFPTCTAARKAARFKYLESGV